MLKSADMETFMIVVHNQNPFTRNYQASLIKNDADLICRLYEQYIDTIEHLVAACSILTLKEYKD